MGHRAGPARRRDARPPSGSQSRTGAPGEFRFFASTPSRRVLWRARWTKDALFLERFVPDRYRWIYDADHMFSEMNDGDLVEVDEEEAERIARAVLSRFSD